MDGGPFQIVIAPPCQSRDVQSIAVTRTLLIIDEATWTFPALPRYSSRLTTRNSSLATLRENLDYLRDFLILHLIPEGMVFLVADPWSKELCAPLLLPLREQYREGVRLLRAGLRNKDCLAWGAMSLKGLGPGLTPSGDDFLCGVLTGLFLLEYLTRITTKMTRDEILSCALGENPISNSLLRSCAEGHFLRRLRDFLEALTNGDRTAVVANASRMLEFGATSGRDLSTGLYLILEYLFTDPIGGFVPNCREVETIQ